MSFKRTGDFSKDFKKLLKKYKTLEQDLGVFKKNVIFVDSEANKNFTILYQNHNLQIIKARFFCRYLRGQTLRIVFACYKHQVIEFIEIYFKGHKANEDRQRIKSYLAGLS